MKMRRTFFGFGKTLSRHKRIMLTFAGAASLVIFWSAASYFGRTNPIFLPTPTAVVASAATLTTDFGLIGDIAASIYRIALGFGLAALVAIPLGIWVGIHKETEAFLSPLVSFMRYTPPSAFIPLFILWLGIGESEKILVIFLAIVPYLLVLVSDEIAGTKQEYIDVGLTLGARPGDILWRIILPQSLPSIWESMRTTIAMGWAFVILAEVVAATSGLGHLIVISQRFLKTANVMAAIIIIGLLGLCIDISFRVGYRHLFPWTERASHA